MEGHTNSLTATELTDMEEVIFIVLNNLHMCRNFVSKWIGGITVLLHIVTYTGQGIIVLGQLLSL